jgi:hypothetical protein
MRSGFKAIWDVQTPPNPITSAKQVSSLSNQTSSSFPIPAFRFYPVTQVAHISDFLWSFVCSQNFLRLSLKSGTGVADSQRDETGGVCCRVWVRRGHRGRRFFWCERARPKVGPGTPEYPRLCHGLATAPEHAS